MEGLAIKAIFVLLGLVFVGIGCFLLWRYKKLEKECTAQVGGIVSDYHHSVSFSKKKKRSSYYPIFKYSVGSIEYVKQSSFGTGSPKFGVGESVTVFYDPSNPKRYYVLEEGKPTVTAIIFIVIGVVFAVVAPFLVFMG